MEVFFIILTVYLLIAVVTGIVWFFVEPCLTTYDDMAKTIIVSIFCVWVIPVIAGIVMLAAATDQVKR